MPLSSTRTGETDRDRTEPLRSEHLQHHTPLSSQVSSLADEPLIPIIAKGDEPYHGERTNGILRSPVYDTG